MESTKTYNLDDLLVEEDSLIQTNVYKDSEENILIDKIILKYFSNEFLNENIIHKINYDVKFKEAFLERINEKLSFMNKSNEVYLFKDLKMIFNLLSLGESIDLFSNLDNSNIVYLLKKYENLLSRQFNNDPSNFNLTFKLYLSLLETFFNLFNLYKENFIRRDKIPAIIDIIIESLNSLKVLMIVSPSNIKDLGIFQGKLLLEYANFLYIDVDNENELIEQYKFIIHKQIDGYFLLTNFCDDISEYEDLYIENVSRAILLLLMKLNKLESYDFSNLDYIMYIYNTDVKNNENSFYDEESFKNELFNNYSLIFNKKENLDILSITKKIVTSDITSKNLRILHDIVLYNDNLEKDDYITVFESLLSSDDLDNNINECMKLKIIDLIIHKFINKKMYEEFLPYSLKLKEYLSRKEIKSYKIFYFSKLHLSLSYFYSFLNNEYIPLIEEEYHLSEQISTFSFIKEHNKKLFKKILLNYSKEHFSLISEDCDFSYNKLLLIADILMKNAFIKEEIKAQYKVEEIKPKLINMILNKPSVNNFTLEKDLSKEINSNIFFNKEEFLVLGKTKEIKEDYELYDESIFDDYNIFVKINNDKLNNNETKNYVLNQIKSISIAFLLNIKKAKYYNNFLQIEEYVSL